MSPRIDAESAAGRGADKVAELLRASSRGRFSVGFHLRQAFDPTSPQLQLRTTAPRKAARLRDRMMGLGVNWLNHVLDALLYLTAAGRHGESATALQIEFLNQLDSHHAFEFVGNGSIDGTGYKRISMAAVLLESWSLIRACQADTDVIRFLHSKEGQSDRNVWSSPFDGFLCGIQKLCQQIGIKKPNLTHYRSLVAAILQVSEFAELFGNRTSTMLLRNGAVFGASAGVTIVSDEMLTFDEEARVLDILRRVLEETETDLKLENEALRKAGRYRPLSSEVTRATKRLLQPARKLNGVKVEDHINWFLDEVGFFCNRTAEQRSLEFGFVLGQPSMMRYWPGSHDVNIPETTFNDLRRDAYLLEPPTERVVTVPYAAIQKIRGAKINGLKIMDLGEIPEQMQGCEERCIWEGSLRPLAHLTAHYPWAVGVSVGPGSRLRVFSNGELRFYRDENGWKEYAAQLTADNTLARQVWPTATAEYSDGLRLLLGFALQFSPHVRRGSHGALLLWLPEAPKKALADLERYSEQMGRDEPEEERGLHSRKPWLTGRSLFTRLDDGQTVLNPYVARQVIRVGLADGATVFINSTAEIWGFRRSLQFPSDRRSCPRYEGVKRLAASQAIAHFAQIPGAVAFVVSSDGPIQVFYRNRSKPGYPVGHVEAFTPLGKEPL